MSRLDWRSVVLFAPISPASSADSWGSRAWRLGWVMLVLVGLHHAVLNYAAPFWVYQYGRNDFAVFAHALPVVIAVVFTTLLCNTHRSTIQQVQKLREDFAAINESLKK